MGHRQQPSDRAALPSSCHARLHAIEWSRLSNDYHNALECLLNTHSHAIKWSPLSNGAAHGCAVEDSFEYSVACSKEKSFEDSTGVSLHA